MQRATKPATAIPDVAASESSWGCANLNDGSVVVVIVVVAVVVVIVSVVVDEVLDIVLSVAVGVAVAEACASPLPSLARSTKADRVAPEMTSFPKP
mmetsp:Transcript_10402/g.30183  ORF Transcript_10402/g.30183 Transcript_10402/m.30183 type:complete len:96 (-) Transcript_10402:58-345(-)